MQWNLQAMEIKQVEGGTLGEKLILLMHMEHIGVQYEKY